MKSGKKIISLFLTLFILLFTVSALAACGEEKYTVKFDSVGGTAVESVTVLPGEKISEPTTPTKDGYVFMGWYNGSVIWNFANDTVSSDITLIAKWISSVEANEATVSFDSKGGSPVNSINLVKGDKVTAPTAPAKPGYTFAGWFLDDKQFDFESYVVASDITLVAKWNVVSYPIVYETAGGVGAEGNPSSYTVESAALSIANPTRLGYDFIGWTFEGQTEPVKDLVIPSGSTNAYTLVANWQIVTYGLSYDLAGGIAGAEYPASFNVTSPDFLIANPTRDYYEFLGWTYEGQATPVKDLVVSIGTTGARHLVANWKAIEYPISYDIANGINNPENPTSYNVASGIITIKAPTRAGYEFKGWLYEGIEEPVMTLEIPAASTGARSFYAVWELVTYTITYHAEGALPYSNSGLTLTYTVNDLPLYPGSVYSQAGVFVGWFADEALTSEVKYINHCDNLNLYAKFVAPTEGLTYSDLGQGYEVNGYTGEEGTVYIPDFYNGKPVLSIGKAAFKNNEVVSTVYLPYTIALIDEEAFYNCDTLVSFNTRLDGILQEFGRLSFADCDALVAAEFGSNVTAIGDNAFFDNSSLKDIIFGQSISKIGSSAFENCDFIEVLSFPASLSEIGDRAFYSLASLTSVDFAENSELYSIGKEAFASAAALKSIVLPKSLTVISDKAFHSATALEAVSFAADSELSSIGNEAFRNCKSLTAIVIPAELTSIGDYAFYSASALASVAISEDSNLASIGAYAFYNCDSLTEFYIPKNVETIGNEAFSDSNNISKVTFAKDSVLSEIGISAFSNCSALTEILVPANATVKSWAFYGCHNLVSVQFPAADAGFGFASYFGGENYIPKKIENIIITGGDAIPAGEFASCTSLKSLKIHSLSGSLASLFGGAVPSTLYSVEISGGEIGANAFESCANVKSLTLGKNVTKVNEAALSGCRALEFLSVPFVGESKENEANGTLSFVFGSAPASLSYVEITDATVIHAEAFAGSSIKTVVLCDSVAAIGNAAFKACKKLELVSFGKDSALSEIGDEAFYGCTSLGSFTAPDNLLEIGKAAFFGANSLEAFNLSENSKLAVIGENAFNSCIALKAFTVPSSVTVLSDSAFAYAVKLESVTLSDNLVTVGASAFEGCASLATVTVSPDSKLTTLGSNAFKDCISLVSFDVVNSVLFINSSAFEGCTSLVNVNFSEDNKLEYLGSSAFKNCKRLGVISLPSTVTRIQNETFFACSSLASVSFGEGSQLSVIDQGAFEGCTTLITVSIPDGVTTISNRAFKECLSLTSVNFGAASQLSSILGYAFDSCISLNSFTLPAGVSEIGDYAFNNCLGLASFAFGETTSLSNIGSYAFADCDSLTSFTIPASVSYIGDFAFFGAEKLAAVSFAEGTAITYLPSYVFYDCVSLEKFTVPASVSYIGDYAFYNAKALKELIFAENSVLESIGNSAFRNAAALESFSAPASLRAIGAYAFSGCSGMKFAHFSLNINEIGSYAFRDCTLEIRFTEAFSGIIPTGWSTYWNPDLCPIIWGYTEPTA